MNESRDILTAEPVSSSDKKSAKLIYVLYLVGFLTTITALIGFVLAFTNHTDDENIINTHFKFQIRTFWIGLLLLIISGVTVAVFIGAIIFIFWIVWTVVRCIQGMKYLEMGKPIPNPDSWMFGK